MEKSYIEENSYDIDAEVADILEELNKPVVKEPRKKRKLIAESDYAKMMLSLEEIEEETLADRLIRESMGERVEAVDLKDFLKKENVL